MKLFRKPNLKLEFEHSSQYVAAFIVSIGVMVEGMHFGWSSPSLPKLLDDSSGLNATRDEVLSIAHMFTYGSIASTVASVVDFPQLSQKITLLLSIFVMTLSWILIGIARTTHVMMVARFLAGVGRFLVYLTSIDYICEIAEPKIRGLLTCTVYIMMNVGLLLVYSIGPYVEVAHCALAGAIISLTELVAIRWVPESPYALVVKNDTGRARSVLKSLRGRWNVEEELDKMSAAVRRQEQENSSYWDCLRVASNRRALIVLSVLNAFQILSGVHISIHNVFRPGGGDERSYEIATLTSFTGIVSCALSALLTDIIGRKPVLVCSFVVSGLTLFVYGMHVYLEGTGEADMDHMIPMSCLVVFTMVYRMGIGMIPLLLSGELLPVNVKNVGSALCGIASVAVSYASIHLLNYVNRVLGDHFMIWFYSSLCIVGCVFTWYFVPETKGLTLEEIQWKLKCS